MWNTLNGNPPLIIAHRGASGYRPEHTLEGYAMAIDQGADVIEPDLVYTKDGILVIRHDRYLSTTTDIEKHPEFANRIRADAYYEKTEGAAREDWWIEDFTLAEIKTLRARQPRAGRSKEFDGLYEIATFDEMLALVTDKSKEAGRPVGVYPETKHPGFFESIGHDFEAPLLAALENFDAGPIFIQSFEAPILNRLKDKTNANLVQLVFEQSPNAGPNIPLADIADYADAVGPAKELIINDEMLSTGFIENAHSLHISVHSWTFRDDEERVFSATKKNYPPINSTTGNVSAVKTIDTELLTVFELGVDAVFTDFPDTAVRVRNALRPLSKPANH